MIEDFIDQLVQLDINIELFDQDKLRIRSGATKVSKDLLNKIELKKKDLLIYLKSRTIKLFQPIPLSSLSDDYVLSSSQRRLWILSLLTESNIAYNIPGVYVFEGALDAGGLESAFLSLIARHEILRTVFRVNEAGDIRQVIHPAEAVGFRVKETDLRWTGEQESVLMSGIRSDFGTAFDLSAGPLLRAGLYRTGESRWVFTYVMHHIISDGWSMEILIRELLVYYNSYVRGDAADLPPLRIQYKDYSAWQQGELSGASLEAHRSYWREQLSGDLPVLELAGDRARPSVKTYNGGQVSLSLDGLSATRLSELARSTGSTLFMGLLTAVNVLLYRYTGQEDLIIGSPIAGRNHSDLEDQIGFYVNTLVLRTRIEPGDSYRSLLLRTREVTLGAYEHQVYPFDELVNDLQLPADRSRNPLFDIQVMLQDGEISGTMNKDTPESLVVSSYPGSGGLKSVFDMVFLFTERNGSLDLSINYNSDIYDGETIMRMGAHLSGLVEAVLNSPDSLLSELDYLSAGA